METAVSWWLIYLSSHGNTVRTRPHCPWFTNTAKFYSASGTTRCKHFGTVTQELYQITTAYEFVEIPAVKSDSDGEDKSPQRSKGGNYTRMVTN
eukprot:14295014-Ditylum_brightwellii.AAC.1